MSAAQNRNKQSVEEQRKLRCHVKSQLVTYRLKRCSGRCDEVQVFEQRAAGTWGRAEKGGKTLSNEPRDGNCKIGCTIYD